MHRKIEVGYIDIPKDYETLKPLQKKMVCNRIIEKLLIHLDQDLSPEINRIMFLNDVFDSTLETNVELENYEIAAVIRDCKKQINED